MSQGAMSQTTDRDFTAASKRPQAEERPTSILRIHPMWAIGIAIAAIIIIVLAIGGYFLGWNWTGFKGNTFWDWMSLLITPVTIATVSILFSVQQSRQSMAENARVQQEATLEAYFEHITHLLLDGHLLETPPESPVRAVARARTVATLQQVGQEHRATIMRFLDESGLTGGDAPVLDLHSANLDGPTAAELT